MSNGDISEADLGPVLYSLYPRRSTSSIAPMPPEIPSDVTQLARLSVQSEFSVARLKLLLNVHVPPKQVPSRGYLAEAPWLRLPLSTVIG